MVVLSLGCCVRVGVGERGFRLEEPPQLGFKEAPGASQGGKEAVGVRAVPDSVGSLGLTLSECNLPGQPWGWRGGQALPTVLRARDEQLGLCPSGSGCHQGFVCFSTSIHRK